MSSPSPSSAPLDDSATATQNLRAETAKFLLPHPEIQKIDLTTVRGTRLRFPEANQAAPSFCPDAGTEATFDKTFASPTDLIPILASRGLIISQPTVAIQWLEKVGCYWLSGYCLWPVEPTSQWFAKPQNPIRQHPNLPIGHMGFPSDWADRLLILQPSGER